MGGRARVERRGRVDADAAAPCPIIPADGGDGGAIAIVTGQHALHALAVEPAPCGAGSVYWATNHCNEDGGIYAAEKDGGNVRRLVTDQICDIAVSKTHLAWSGYTLIRVAQLEGNGLDWSRATATPRLLVRIYAMSDL